MYEEQNRFLAALGRPPARLDSQQAAWIIGCQKHDVPALVAARLLKPLGNPPPNGIKFFATTDVLELMQDRAWLVRVTNTITQHWYKRNAWQKNRLAGTRRNGAADSDGSAPLSNN